jgi:flagellar basal body-associated protein FliL
MTEQQSEGMFSPEAPQKKSNTGLIIFIVVVVLLLCCCAFVLIFYFYLGDILLEYLDDFMLQTGFRATLAA